YTSNNLSEHTKVGNATFTYDSDGNVASRTDASGTTTYDYDAEDRLVRVTTPAGGTWEYTYTALSQRSKTTHNGVAIDYVYDGPGFGDLVAEYNANGQLSARYDYANGLAARSDSSGTVAFYNFDLGGNTREITGTDGSVLNHYEYDPFGAIRDQI